MEEGKKHEQLFAWFCSREERKREKMRDYATYSLAYVDIGLSIEQSTQVPPVHGL
jgi:hypothetical protein